jgi:hypothetical protein
MTKHLFAVAGLGAILFTGLFVSPLRADEWDKLTDISVKQPINVDGTILPPGQYVLKVMDSPSDRNIVEIYNETEQHLIKTVLALPAYRQEPTGHPVFSFYETPAGHPQALRTYFYPGDEMGFQFPEHQ